MKPFISQVNGKNFYLYYQHPTTLKVTRVTTKTQDYNLAELFKFDFVKNLNSVSTTGSIEVKLMNKKEIKLSHFITNLYDYLHNHVTQSTLNLYHTTMKDFFAVVGNKLLTDISITDVERYKLTISKRMKKITVNKNIKNLKSAFNIAVDKMELLEKSPVKKVELYRTEKNMIQYLEKAEIEKILSVVEEDYMKKIILFALYTGMRLGEILSLKWSDVDYSNKCIKIQNKEEINYQTKNKRFRILSLTKSISKILDVPSLNQDSFVFMKQYGCQFATDYISKKFKQYARQVGLDKLKFHYLRHTFATNCIKQGVSIYHLQQLLGHSSITVTMNYLHCTITDVQTSMDKLSYGIELESEGIAV